MVKSSHVDRDIQYSCECVFHRHPVELQLSLQLFVLLGAAQGPIRVRLQVQRLKFLISAAWTPIRSDPCWFSLILFIVTHHSAYTSAINNTPLNSVQSSVDNYIEAAGLARCKLGWVKKNIDINYCDMEKTCKVLLLAEKYILLWWREAVQGLSKLPAGPDWATAPAMLLLKKNYGLLQAGFIFCSRGHWCGDNVVTEVTAETFRRNIAYNRSNWATSMSSQTTMQPTVFLKCTAINLSNIVNLI